MKTRPQFYTIGIIALAAIIVFAIIACKDGNDDPPPEWSDSVTIDGKTIPVYKAADVSDADADATVANIKEAIELLSAEAATYHAANITKIEIGGDGITLTSGVLKVKANPNKISLAASLENIYLATVEP